MGSSIVSVTKLLSVTAAEFMCLCAWTASARKASSNADEKEGEPGGTDNSGELRSPACLTLDVSQEE